MTENYSLGCDGVGGARTLIVSLPDGATLAYEVESGEALPVDDNNDVVSDNGEGAVV